MDKYLESRERLFFRTLNETFGITKEFDVMNMSIMLKTVMEKHKTEPLIELDNVHFHDVKKLSCLCRNIVLEKYKENCLFKTHWYEILIDLCEICTRLRRINNEECIMNSIAAFHEEQVIMNSLKD